MALADIVKLSEEELCFLTGLKASAGDIRRDDPRTLELIDRLQGSAAPGLLFVTFGKDGCRWQGPRGAGCLDTLRVDTLDTTGAGDCFMAGILFRFLALGRSLRELSAPDYLEMALHGVTAGALSAERRGGIPSIPALAEVMTRLPAAPTS